MLESGLGEWEPTERRKTEDHVAMPTYSKRCAVCYKHHGQAGKSLERYVDLTSETLATARCPSSHTAMLDAF